MVNWFEEKWQWILLILVVVLLITISFGAGYLIGREANPAPIIIEKNALP